MINAVVLVAEVGDFTRFANPRQLMACRVNNRAISPSVATVSPRPATLTPAALVEGAWAYRMKAHVGRCKVDRVEILPKAVRDIAWKAQVRLCARNRKLRARGKNPDVVNVAIAREMVGFVWSIAYTIQVESMMA